GIAYLSSLLSKTPYRIFDKTHKISIFITRNRIENQAISRSEFLILHQRSSSVGRIFYSYCNWFVCSDVRRIGASRHLNTIDFKLEVIGSGEFWDVLDPIFTISTSNKTQNWCTIVRAGKFQVERLLIHAIYRIIRPIPYGNSDLGRLSRNTIFRNIYRGVVHIRQTGY